MLPTRGRCRLDRRCAKWSRSCGTGRSRGIAGRLPGAPPVSQYDGEEAMVYEPPGFRRFVEARYSSLVRFGIVLCGDPGRGEELTQSALVTTLHAWNRLGVGLGDPEGHTRDGHGAASVADRRPPAWRATGGPSRRPWFRPSSTGSCRPSPTSRSRRSMPARPCAMPSRQCPRSSGWCSCSASGSSSARPRSPRSCAARPARSATASARAVAALRESGLLDDPVDGRTSAEARQIEQLLTRAADVPPVSTQPTDDVLARAERAPRARLRRRLLRWSPSSVVCALLIGLVRSACRTATRPPQPGGEAQAAAPDRRPSRRAGGTTTAASR